MNGVIGPIEPKILTIARLDQSERSGQMFTSLNWACVGIMERKHRQFGTLIRRPGRRIGATFAVLLTLGLDPMIPEAGPMYRSNPLADTEGESDDADETTHSGTPFVVVEARPHHGPGRWNFLPKNAVRARAPGRQDKNPSTSRDEHARRNGFGSPLRC